MLLFDRLFPTLLTKIKEDREKEENEAWYPLSLHPHKQRKEFMLLVHLVIPLLERKSQEKHSIQHVFLVRAPQSDLILSGEPGIAPMNSSFL